MPTLKNGQFVDGRRRSYPMTDAERQARYRKARLDAGQPEIRGIYADPRIHAQIRAFARSLQTALDAPAAPDTRQHTLPL